MNDIIQDEPHVRPPFTSVQINIPVDGVREVNRKGRAFDVEYVAIHAWVEPETGKFRRAMYAHGEDTCTSYTGDPDWMPAVPPEFTATCNCP